MKSIIVLYCSWIVAAALLSQNKMFPQVLNAVVLGEGEESNLLEIICLMSFTIRLQKSLQESQLGLFGSLNSSLNQIVCADHSSNIKS